MARVLVVEDDRPIATMIADELGASGHRVEIACDGHEALMSLQSSPPDAIVLDLMMPKLNGWHFVEQYRAHTGGQTIPIVVVSVNPILPRSFDRFGVRRCMWESDCPFQVVEHKYQDSIDLIRKGLNFLTADDKDWLLRRTAEEFFFKR